MGDVVKFPPKPELDPQKLRTAYDELPALIDSIQVGPFALPYIAHLAFICSTQPQLLLSLMNKNLTPNEIAVRLLEQAIQEVEDAELDEELRASGIDPNLLRQTAAIVTADDPSKSH